MRNGATIKDRYDLPLTTDSPEAADRYVEGIDRFLSQVYGPEEALEEAVEVDDGLAVAHAAVPRCSRCTAWRWTWPVGRRPTPRG